MEKTDIAKYTIKDSLFTNLFQENKVDKPTSAPPLTHEGLGHFAAPSMVALAT